MSASRGIRNDKRNFGRMLLPAGPETSLHDLRRGLFYAHEGAVRHRHLDQQNEQAWCLTLVTNTVVAWTTDYYGLAVDTMRRDRRHVSVDVLAHISPAHSDNVNYFGAITVDIDRETCPARPGRLSAAAGAPLMVSHPRDVPVGDHQRRSLPDAPNVTTSWCGVGSSRRRAGGGEQRRWSGRRRTATTAGDRATGPITAMALGHSHHAGPLPDASRSQPLARCARVLPSARRQRARTRPCRSPTLTTHIRWFRGGCYGDPPMDQPITSEQASDWARLAAEELEEKALPTFSFGRWPNARW